MKLLKKPKIRKSTRSGGALNCSVVCKTDRDINQQIKASRINNFLELSKTLKSTVDTLFVDQKDIDHSVRQARKRVVKRIYDKDI